MLVAVTATVPGPLPTSPAVAPLRAGRLPRRLVQLLLGLALYGATLAMIVRATLGNAPWDVLHQGMARHLPLSFGSVLILTSVLVLVLWVPLRERPGLGTLANALLVGLAADATLAVLSTPDSWVLRAALLLGGVVGNAAATAVYLGARLGSGPRDGLMTGLHRRTGVPIGVVRTGLETTVVVLGFVLGGLVGLGTLLYALTIGPLTQLLLPAFVVELDPSATTRLSDGSR
jgi:uncharacterized membrane protein YczE